MKVMCIKDNWLTNPDYKGGRPLVGGIYNVVGTETHWGLQYYVLDDFTPHVRAFVEHFVLISEIDETELIKERELVTI